MAVDGGEGHRGRPLVVLFVDVLVDPLMMQHPVRVKETNLFDDEKDDEF